MAFDLQDFDSQVLQRSHEVPVLVDFWSPHCGPCLMFAPILEGMAEKAEGKWDLIKINTLDHPEIASEYGVSGIPDIRLFVDGEIVEQFLGMRGEDEVEKLIKKHLPSPNQDQIDQARELLEAKEFGKAAAILEGIEGKEDTEWFLLAYAYLGSDPAKVASACDPIPYDSDLVDKSNALLKLAELVLAKDQLPDSDVRPAFEKGLDAVQQYTFGDAFEAFIEVLREDPRYADSAAAEACKAMVQFLGIRHPVADKYQRIFSSLLYS